MKNKNKILSILLVLVLLFVSACDFNDNSSSPSDKPSYNLSTPGASSGDDSTDEIKELTYTDITLLTSGDIMYHNTQLKSAKNSDGTYDFTDNFKYMKDIVSSADLAVVNYETTTANQKDYTAYPVFNSPLESLAVTKDTGYDLLLFANNHCYDYRKDGFLATLNQFENYGFEYIGGKKTADAKSYMVKDVKGVKLGLMNFTDTITPPTSNYYTINGNAISDGCEELMDIYVRGEYDKLYSEVSNRIEDMKNQGADIIIMYIHWGDEYLLDPVSSQTEVAQKLCDLGVDVIIGGHPHVIEPMEILKSKTDPEHTTLCFYSLGNFISNQNRLSFADLAQSIRPYTENGLTVTLTIRKYNTGDVYVKSIDYTPTWVHRYSKGNGKYNYNVVPLNLALNNPSEYGLYNSDFGMSHAEAAFKMTNDVFSVPVTDYNTNMANEIAVFSASFGR